MNMIRIALRALFTSHCVVDNTPGGEPAPDAQDAQTKVIPTMPPADPTLDASEARMGIDPDAHTTIAGLDADGQPVTVKQVLDKQDELNKQTGTGNEPNPVLNPYVGKDPQSTTVPENNPDLDPKTDPTRTDVSGTTDAAAAAADKPVDPSVSVDPAAGNTAT